MVQGGGFESLIVVHGWDVNELGIEGRSPLGDIQCRRLRCIGGASVKADAGGRSCFGRYGGGMIGWGDSSRSSGHNLFIAGVVSSPALREPHSRRLRCPLSSMGETDNQNLGRISLNSCNGAGVCVDSSQARQRRVYGPIRRRLATGGPLDCCLESGPDLL